MEKISIDDYSVAIQNIFSKMKNDWALLTAGTENSFNAMTIGWLTQGILWGKKVVTVYVRPARHTYQFIEDNEYFTVSFYQKEYKKQLGIFGSKSGRDTDKVKETNFHPYPIDKTMTFSEASFTIVCKKIYEQDLDVAKLNNGAPSSYYNGQDDDYHRMYIGEVIDVYKS